jgi:hypothetical protein
MNSSSNRILIPEAAGGPRLRYDARPWIIMMASSVHHADNAERNDALKWSIDSVQTARLWLQEALMEDRGIRFPRAAIHVTAFTGNFEQSIWLCGYIMQITL